jgi:hypothetical protein
MVSSSGSIISYGYYRNDKNQPRRRNNTKTMKAQSSTPLNLERNGFLKHQWKHFPSCVYNRRFLSFNDPIFENDLLR